MRKGKQAKRFVTSFRNELYLPQYVGKAAFVLYISANAQKCPNKYWLEKWYQKETTTQKIFARDVYQQRLRIR